MTAFHQAKGENPLAKRYQEIVDYIKEKIDYYYLPGNLEENQNQSLGGSI